MTIAARCRLALLVLAAAPFAAGCGESHAPAATSSAAGDDVGNRAASTASGPKQDIAVGLHSSGQVGGPASTEIKQNSPQNARDAAAKTAKTPAAPASNAAVSRLPSGAGGASDITFDTIKFPMEKTERYRSEMLTPAIRALEGRRIRIRGYILPSFQQTGITQFVLVRDNMQCCFGPGAALYDCIVVEMAAGKSTEFKVQPVTVEGVFSISELLDPDGKCLAVFHLTGESVR
jgi:hypothetical protein